MIKRYTLIKMHIMMGLSLPKQRKRVIYSMLTGTFLFLALVLYSQFI